ncbi:hypothetical protein F0L68_39315 [Solihabitans fulvus]|uniref:Uncharacterized protein n=1 Tax=Solihabitans fulvus TaxID=1892852 RepID=A0A5B2WFW1_9PSEU|nr:hypothetical protein [Solihabitans fulvus]KAA2249542.1 hypothetical protein F0L68_39315 [Solihabitans fulvus]
MNGEHSAYPPAHQPAERIDIETRGMIRAGRDVVDQHDVATLHGLAWETARRRTPRPWESPHPAPVNAKGEAGRAVRGQQRPLYDAEQASAFANGQPVPPLPDTDAAEDLLDQDEAAELLGVESASWYSGVRDGYLPTADSSPHGVDHWFRRTVTEAKAHRAGRGAGGGRPPNAAAAVAASPRERVFAVLRSAAQAGENLSLAELMVRAGVSRPTAVAHRNAWRSGCR